MARSNAETAAASKRVWVKSENTSIMVKNMTSDTKLELL